VIGLGVDVVDLERFAAVLERRPTITDRLFTVGERTYCERAVAAPATRVERYAARFAVKEAVLKALGVGLGACGWHEIEVERAESGAPSVVLTGQAATLAKERNVATWHVSITHDHNAAYATVIAE
jgi:holo-[acyl-carrier protein] synthase